MASSFTTNYGFEEIATGEQSGSWGTTTNFNYDILDRIASYKSVALSDASTATLTVREASPGSGTENLQDGMFRVIKFTGSLSQNCTITIAPNTTTAYFLFVNATNRSLILSQGSGANVTIATSSADIVYCDGAGSGAAVASFLANNLVFGADVSIGDDLSLLSDAAILNFGADSDVNLTHVADAGLLLNAAMYLSFRDSALKISSTTDGQLDIDADTEVEITAPTIDLTASTKVTVSTDMEVGDDLSLTSDSAVLNFGSDSDINLTHAADTSLTLGGAGSTTGLIVNNTATDGDPFLAFALSGTAKFSMGVDDGDSDLFKIGTTAIGTNTALSIDSAGVTTFGHAAIGSTLTDTSNTGSVTLDFATSQNFILTFTGNVTLANPSTEAVGQSGVIVIIQDGTGSRTLSLGTDYETPAGADLTISTAASAVDIIPYFVKASGSIQLGAPQLAFS
jgi:hypothetical protein|tara:strand:- start:240 stop:1598 length:1359 start_codon:yes stop_codon:yes gene_type:complete